MKNVILKLLFAVAFLGGMLFSGPLSAYPDLTGYAVTADDEDTCAIVSLPYTMDFDNVPAPSTVMPPCFYGSTAAGPPPVIILSAQSHILRINAGYGNSSYFVFPQLGPDIDISTLKLSFRYSPLEDNNSGFQIGFVTDPQNFGSTFTAVHTIPVTADPNWRDYSVTFEEYIGTGRYMAIKWTNGTSGILLDDFLLEVLSGCAPITDFVLHQADASSALLSFNNSISSPMEYTLQYTTDSTQGWQTMAIPQSPVLLSGLEELTLYTARIKSVCSEEDQSEWVYLDFYTMCGSYTGDTIGTGNGTTLGDSIPIGPSNYSYSQQLFMVDELGEESFEAAGISFLYNSTEDVNRSLAVYMANTNQSVFAQGPVSSWIPAHQLTKVFDGNVSFSSQEGEQWVNIPFPEPFLYDGTSNLVVGVLDRSGEASRNIRFYTHATEDNKSIYTTDITPINPEGGSPVYYHIGAFRNHIRLLHCGDFICSAPSVITIDARSSSAHIAWGASSSVNPGYHLEYKKSDEEGWTSVETIYDNHYELTLLEGNTTYDIRLRTLCFAEEDTSSWSTRSFTTPFGQMALPFRQDFDLYQTGQFPGDWDRYTAGTGNEPRVLRSPSDTTQYTSRYSSLYFPATGASYNRIVLPEIPEEEDITDVTMAFDARFSNAGATQYLIAGVMSDPARITTFTAVDTLYADAANVWQYNEVSFRDYEGEGGYITLMWANSGTHTLLLDNFYIDRNSPCVRPYHVTVANITETSAEISWDANGSSGPWIVEYGAHYFTPGEGVQYPSVNNFYVLSDLTENTDYDVYIYSQCNADTSWPSDVARFFTPQIPDTLVFRCDFEAAASRQGWSFANDLNPNQWVIGEAVNNTENGRYSLYISADGGQTNDFISDFQQNYSVWSYRDIDFTQEASQYVLSFDWRNNGGAYAFIGAYIGEPVDVVSGMQSIPAGDIDTVALKLYGSTEWQNVTHILPASYHGTVKRIYFLWYNSSAPNPGGAIDNITILPDFCATPVGFAVSNPTDSSVDLSWMKGAADAWIIEYGERDFVPGTGTLLQVDTFHYTLSGLNPSTFYDFYVRNYCAEGDTSLRSQKMTIMTGQTPATLPYFCDFEDASENRQWAIIDGNGTSHWYIGTAVNNTIGGTHSLYISNDGGLTNSYEGAATEWAYRDIQLGHTEEGEFLLSFDWRALGETWSGSPADYVRIYAGAPLDVRPSNPNLPGSPTLLVDRINGQPDWGTARAILPASFSDSLIRLYILWYSNGTGDYQPAAAIDNISVEMRNCVSPFNVTVYGVTDESAIVAWNHPSLSSGWEVEYKIDTASSWIRESATIAQGHVISNLEDSTTYMVRVRAICGAGDTSAFSPVTQFTTFASVAEECTQPSGVSVSGQGTTVATIHWNDISDATWSFEYKEESAAQYTVILEDDTFYRLTQLLPSTTYNVRIKTICSDDNESAYAELDFTTQDSICTITATAGVNGIITPSGAIRIKMGSDTTFTIEADPDYRIEMVTVDGQDVGERSSYTFTNVRENHAISASFITTGIDDYANNRSMTVYPNPAHDKLYLRLDYNDAETIAITNLLGKVIWSTPVTTNEMEIDIHSLGKGVYFISTYSKGGIITSKFIKE